MVLSKFAYACSSKRQWCSSSWSLVISFRSEMILGEYWNSNFSRVSVKLWVFRLDMLLSLDWCSGSSSCCFSWRNWSLYLFSSIHHSFISLALMEFLFLMSCSQWSLSSHAFSSTRILVYSVFIFVSSDLLALLSSKFSSFVL